MNLKKILILLIILTIFINISSIYATDNNTEILNENDNFNLYVDINNGNNDNTGNNWDNPVKTIQKAIDLTPPNGTSNIYLSNGTFTGDGNTQLKIENKNIINLIGSNSTIISGENIYKILTISNTTKLTMKNIQFVNATISSNYGSVIDINKDSNVIIENCIIKDNTKSSIYNAGNLTINNTLFKNNKDRVNDIFNSVLGGAIRNIGNLIIDNSNFTENYAGSGGAIYNRGNLTLSNSAFRYNKATCHGGSLIEDSIKTRADGGRGGDICNFGNAIITNSTFKNTEVIDLGYHGGSIYNNGTIVLKKVEISDINGAKVSDPIGRHSLGTAIANIGDITVEDSIIKNIITVHAYQGRIQGAVHNEGLFTAVRTVFENNQAESLVYNPIYYDIGSGNIYNTGEGLLNVTSCVFLNNNTYAMSTVVQDVMIRAGSAISLENNSWNGEDPLSNYHLYGTLNVTKYWKISLEPEYTILNISEKTNITEVMTLMYEKHTVDYSQLPELYVTFTVNGQNITKKIVDGKASVEFNQSDVKGSYKVIANLGGNIQTADIDVGKELCDMDVEAEEIYYGDDATFYMTVTGNYTHQPTGKITVIIDEQKYSANINNTKASLSVSGLIPKTYDLIIKYEGDEDYCKSIFHKNYTVSKRPTHINMTIDEIYYGEQGKIKITIDPEKVSTQAYLYITDENNKTTKKNTYVRNGTELTLKNYAAGEYIITLETWENRYYESCNATAIFKVKKYETNLTINATDINAGEDEILTITLNPKGEVAGEATLIINNHTEIIFLKNGGNTVTINNVTGGIYNVTVYFQGDKKYGPSNATSTFTAKKLQSNITAKIENSTLYIDVEPKTTGTVLIYINDEIYEVNLTDSKIELPINFTKAENNIFIYYQGNGYYNYSTYNLTYEYEELVNLTGYDETFYNTQNATYYITLTDEEGYGIANKNITITINNETYTETTEYDGSITLKLDLNVGNYTVTAQYKNKTLKNTITILEDAFLNGNDTQAYTNIDFTYTIQLKDHNGKAITNAEIKFEVDGKTCTNKTDENGIAILNLNLKEGNYTITSTYKNITKTAKIIIVDDSHLIGNDVKAYSGVNFTYRTKLTDHNNNPMTDVTLTFTFENKTYTNTTNSNGESTLTFNLETGNYTITTNYKNTTIENIFEIIEDYILRGNDIKAYAETDFQYKINLTDHNGKTITNAEITFEVDGKTYTNTTDSEGKAVINLNLKLGNHTIKTTYRNTTTENNLEMIEDYILSGNDIKAYAETDFQYKINLTDHNGKTITNAEITFEVDEKTYTNTTNNNGEAILNLNLNEGNYTIKTTYKNTTATNELEIIEDHLIIGQNIRAFEKTDFKYTITLTRTDGTPINGKTVTFVINNRRYTSTTNETGQASRTLNLPEGNYTITAIYKNTAITNNLTIIEEYNLNATNIRAYAETDFQYKVNLTNHEEKAVNNAEITFKVNGKTYTNKTDNNGQAILNLNLQKGNYTITSTYRNIKLTGKLEIIETYQLTGINAKSYENFDFDYIVTLTNHNNKTIENQIITFDVDGETYTNTTDNNGQAKINLNLKKGNYTITTKYNNISTTNKLEIIEYDLEKIENENLEMFYRDGSRFTIRLTENNTPLTNRTVNFTINNRTYSKTTDNQGYAGIAINLNSGKYNITTQYNNLSKVNSILVKSTINGNDLVKMYRNDTQYRATFYNKKGELLKNTQIMFNINGVLYYRNTNENGTAQLTINLNTGEYIITATNPETSEQHSNTITVLSKIQENNDLTKYYRNESQYTVKIIKSNGQVAGKSEKVTFNINGVFYERYTNESGYAKININLQPGTFIITAEYEGCLASNNIKVLPTLQTKDLTKKYGTANPFEATLLNGQGKPQANEKITFNINGVFYDRTTDENGTARLNINLQAGTYIITSQYGTAITSNTVKVTP
ncbi:Ig-like domain repeat protein [Methanobrevibacter sp.]|uniref:Ig-like domain repeat protein n=1 Tax=Methanobrevibacter sp. TaxID=66852 RepID=UPI00388FA813